MKHILYVIISMALCLPAQAQTVAEQLKGAEGLGVFSRLVEAVGLSDTLSKVRDEEYESQRLNGNLGGNTQLWTDAHETAFPEHRNYGFTVFAETDDFWQQTLGKAADGITVADVADYVGAKGLSLSDFVNYHILPVRLAPDRLVIHYNERGYNYANPNLPFTIPTYEVYTTLDGHQLLKLYQCGPAYSLDGDSKVYLNRTPELDDRMQGTCRELSVTAETAGIAVDTALVTSGENGYIYPISSLLAYDDNVRRKVLGTRLRYDVASLFPELMNSGIRANRAAYQITEFPAPNYYQYLGGLQQSYLTRFYYLNGYGCNWMNWQGDEFAAIGLYDFTLRLPPVPTDGEYELRLGTQSNSYYRDIVLFYIGADKDNLEPAGGAVDMREGGLYLRHRNGNFSSSLDWEADTGDDVYDRSVDLRLREEGVMKGPANFSGTPGGTQYPRNQESTLRRIVWRGDVKAGEPLYLRVRSTMNDDRNWFYLDYLEWCPKSVYANPEKPEDIW